jgi:hypothetical protein
VVLNDLIGNRASRNLAGPAYQLWNPKCALPIRVLLAAEGSHRAIRPAIHVRSIVGAIYDEGVVRDLEFVQDLQHVPHVLVVVDHGVMIG